MLREMLSDSILWICLGWVASLVVAAHYFVVRYHLWRRGMSVIGRYVSGVLAIGLPFAGWCVTHPDLVALDVLAAFCACAVVAGAVTVSVYLVDSKFEDGWRGEDLDKLGVGDGAT